MSEVMIVCPVIDARSAAGFVKSLAPTMRQRVLMVDNCLHPLGPAVAALCGTVERFEHNIGVAAAWNVGITAAREHGCTHVVLCSSSVRFGDRGGRDLPALCEQAGEWGTAPAPTYWHTLCASLAWFDRIGMPDENFYPAYFEDTDLSRRAALAGCPMPNDGVLDAVNTRDGAGVDRLRADFPGQLTISHDALVDYWRAKWGVHHHRACEVDIGYRHPFDDERLPLSWWPPVDSIPALRRRYGIVGR